MGNRLNFPLRKILFLFFCLFLIIPLFAQSRKGLETRRKKLLKDISLTNQLLQNTTKNKEAAYKRLLTLQSQIKKREELILTLRQEIEFSDKNMQRTSDVVDALEEDVKRLEEEFTILARDAYRQKMTNGKWWFLFSSESFNQAFKRWQYLKQYDRYRAKQADLILATKGTLSQKIELLEEQRLQKEQLLLEAEAQAQNLDKERLDKKKMVQSLKTNEQRLQSDLTKKRKAHQKLNDAIEKVIIAEMTAQRKASRDRKQLDNNVKRNSDTKTNSASNFDEKRKKRSQVTRQNPERKPLKEEEKRIIQLGNDFYTNRGRLPWPVRKGIITSHFGRQPHPSLKNVEITNNGIDIQTSPGAKVYALFDGEVVGLQFVPGFEYMLIIQHGSYYTVYSHLEEAFVKKGERVSRRQEIGYLSVDGTTNSSEVHLEVWRNKTRLNPERWIVR